MTTQEWLRAMEPNAAHASEPVRVYSGFGASTNTATRLIAEPKQMPEATHNQSRCNRVPLLRRHLTRPLAPAAASRSATAATTRYTARTVSSGDSMTNHTTSAATPS